MPFSTTNSRCGLDGQPLVGDLLGDVVGDDDDAVDVAHRLPDAGPHALPVGGGGVVRADLVVDEVLDREQRAVGGLVPGLDASGAVGLERPVDDVACPRAG